MLCQITWLMLINHSIVGQAFESLREALNLCEICSNLFLIFLTLKKTICSEYPKFLLLYLFNSEFFAYTQILKVRMTMMINRRHETCTCSQVIQKPYLHHLNRLLSLMALTMSRFCLNADGHQEKTPQLCQYSVSICK